MWQLSGGPRFFAHAPASTWHVSPRTPPDLELGAMSPMSYSTSEPSRVGDEASSLRSPSPLLLPTRSLVNNCPRPDDEGLPAAMGNATQAGPLTQMLRGDVRLARAAQAQLDRRAASLRAQALGVAALLQTYDVARLYPVLAGLQRALADAERAGAPAQYRFLTPSCVFGAQGLGVLAPASLALRDAPRRLEALALGLGRIDDAAVFMGRLATGLEQLSAQHRLLAPDTSLTPMLAPLHPGETVLWCTGPHAVADAPWPWAQAATQALWVGVSVGFAALTPRVGAAAGLGTLAYQWAASQHRQAQNVREAWAALAADADDEDEGYGSAMGRTYTGQSRYTPELAVPMSGRSSPQSPQHVESVAL